MQVLDNLTCKMAGREVETVILGTCSRAERFKFRLEQIIWIIFVEKFSTNIKWTVLTLSLLLYCLQQVQSLIPQSNATFVSPAFIPDMSVHIGTPVDDVTGPPPPPALIWTPPYLRMTSGPHIFSSNWYFDQFWVFIETSIVRDTCSEPASSCNCFVTFVKISWN